MELEFTLNGKPVSLSVEADKRLITMLREDFGLTGTKEGCSEGECGACTILLDGQCVHACLVLATQLQHKTVLTIEGLSGSGALSDIQRIFMEEGAVQCGYCSSGMIMAAYALLLENAAPSVEEIRTALAGNLCRCSGYQQIVRAVQRTAEEACPHA